MTLRDGEVVELLNGQPELLAIADAVAETQRPPRRLGRRPSVARFILTAAVAAVAVTVLLVSPWNGRGSVVGRALAAVGDGRVLHLVVQAPTGQVFVNLQDGARTT